MGISEKRRLRITFLQVISAVLLVWGAVLMAVCAYDARGVQGGIFGRLGAVWLGNRLYSADGEEILLGRGGLEGFFTGLTLLTAYIFTMALALAVLAAVTLWPRAGLVRAGMCSLLALATVLYFLRYALFFGLQGALLFVLPPLLYCFAAARRFAVALHEKRAARSLEHPPMKGGYNEPQHETKQQ